MSNYSDFISLALGTPSSGTLTFCTGTAAGLTAGNVLTNANLTGDVTSVGNATTLTNAPVIAKLLTGYTSSAGTISASDSILIAVQKLNGNDLNLTSVTYTIAVDTNAVAIGNKRIIYFVSGTTILTLPTAVGNTNRYTVVNTGVGVVTVNTTSSQTIIGSLTVTLPITNMSLDFISDNSNWSII